MNNIVKNFVQSTGSHNEIRVISIPATPDFDNATVSIICSAGSCRFQHNMTPVQARELAGYLVAEANLLDKSKDAPFVIGAGLNGSVVRVWEKQEDKTEVAA